MATPTPTTTKTTAEAARAALGSRAPPPARPKGYAIAARGNSVAFLVLMVVFALVMAIFISLWVTSRNGAPCGSCQCVQLPGATSPPTAVLVGALFTNFVSWVQCGAQYFRATLTLGDTKLTPSTTTYDVARIPRQMETPLVNTRYPLVLWANEDHIVRSSAAQTSNYVEITTDGKLLVHFEDMVKSTTNPKTAVVELSVAYMIPPVNQNVY